MSVLIKVIFLVQIQVIKIIQVTDAGSYMKSSKLVLLLLPK